MVDCKGLHVLVIEDEILIAMEIEQQLRDFGFSTVDFARSPAAALSSASARKPDLITADMQIVDGTGYEAVQAISAAIGPAPVIYITGNRGMLSDHEDNLIIDKPMAFGALAKACARLGYTSN